MLQYNYDQHTSYHEVDLWIHTLKVVAATPQDNLPLRWAALLLDIAKPMTRTEQMLINHNVFSMILSDEKLLIKYAHTSNFQKNVKIRSLLQLTFT